MLLYATEFPTAEGATAADFIDLIKTWALGSPNYPWVADDLDVDLSEDLVSIEKSPHQIQLTLSDLDGDVYGAAHYRYVENGEREWVTELVSQEIGDHLWVSVRVHCKVLATGAVLPEVKKPYIIRQILAQFGGGDDAGLTIRDSPRLLEDSEVAYAAALISGEVRNRLPIVYVSSGWEGLYALDPKILAQVLSGSAHVVVEPSRQFSFRLKPICDGRNAYGGAIGIYWPSGQLPTERIFVESRNRREAISQIADRIQSALCQAQPSDMSTWMAVRALLARKRTAALRESGSGEVDDWIDAFSTEIEIKDQQLADARREVERLRAELRASERVSSTGGKLLPDGREQDLFPGERAEIVREALEHALASSGSESRKAHVLQDLVEAAPDTTFRDDLAARVKGVLENKRRLASRDKSELEALGFTLTEDGPHYKAVFRGDPRYQFSFPKTGSDHRGSLNLVSQVNKTLFK